MGVDAGSSCGAVRADFFVLTAVLAAGANSAQASGRASSGASVWAAGCCFTCGVLSVCTAGCFACCVCCSAGSAEAESLPGRG